MEFRNRMELRTVYFFRTLTPVNIFLFQTNRYSLRPLICFSNSQFNTVNFTGYNPKNVNPDKDKAKVTAYPYFSQHW